MHVLAAQHNPLPHTTPPAHTQRNHQSLEEQLLAELVSAERPGLEAQRDETITAIGGDRRQLAAVEARILALLRDSTASLLDDGSLVATLTAAKYTAGVWRVMARHARRALLKP
jgi:hypothetical protein